MHHQLTDLAQLIRNSWNIPEIPISQAIPANPQLVDLILVPGLAFTLQGTRLGQGKGYYDRFLSHLPSATLLGVCWQAHLLETLPEETHDVRMHGILTEEQLYWPLPLR